MKFSSKLSKEILVCSEPTVRDYKELLKCSYGENPDPVMFAETVCEILANVSNKSIEYFKRLDLINLFALLLDLRINSQGTICKIVLTKDDKKVNLDLRIDLMRQDTAKMFEFVTFSVKQNNLEIVLECPCIERLLQPASEDCLPFVCGMYLETNGTTKFVEITTNEQAQALCERISPKTSLQIIKACEQFMEATTKVNFLSRYGVADQPLCFVPSMDSLTWFAKILFSESLGTFYDNLFYLAHLGHMDTRYVEECSVGEYNYFVGCLMKTLASKSSSSGDVQSAPVDHTDGLTDF